MTTNFEESTVIIVTGNVTAREDSFEALREASLAHVHRSRAEDRCLLHSVLLSTNGRE